MARAIEALEASFQKTNVWLRDVCEELRTNNRRQAYTALRAVLHTMRDCLPVEECAKFAGQLPLIVKGVFYDGWHPRRKPERLDRSQFYERVQTRLRGTGVEAAAAVRAVLLTCERHLSRGEIDCVQHVAPKDVRELWRSVEESGIRGGRETAGAGAQAPSMPAWP